MICRVVVIFFTYWLLAAHFLRDGNTIICAFIALFPLLIFSKNIIAFRTLQVGLVLAVLFIWLPSTFSMVEYRMVTERPWFRLVSIMTAVMIFNFFAAWCVSGVMQLQRKNKE